MTVQVQGLAWLGTRTEEFDEMCRLYGVVFGLPRVASAPGFAAYRLPSGDLIEVFRPDLEGQEHFTTGPVAGFAVADIEAARAEMEANYIEFLGPTGGESGGHRWAHFRGPDGNVYELTQRADG
jgi:catechol 2,3-dioxygenase-like lactoylglutathione lyase family enzyme